jgi:hypothetical protein
MFYDDTYFILTETFIIIFKNTPFEPVNLNNIALMQSDHHSLISHAVIEQI